MWYQVKVKRMIFFFFLFVDCLINLIGPARLVCVFFLVQLCVSALMTSFQLGVEGVVLSCNILSEQLCPNKSRGCITEWSLHENVQHFLLLWGNNRCLTDDGWQWSVKGIERKEMWMPFVCFPVVILNQRQSIAPIIQLVCLLCLEKFFSRCCKVLFLNMNLIGQWGSCNLNFIYLVLF